MSKKAKLHLIPLEMFCLDVAVFATESERIETLTAQGCDDLTRHSDAALSSAQQSTMLRIAGRSMSGMVFE